MPTKPLWRRAGKTWHRAKTSPFPPRAPRVGRGLPPGPLRARARRRRRSRDHRSSRGQGRQSCHRATRWTAERRTSESDGDPSRSGGSERARPGGNGLLSRRGTTALSLSELSGTISAIHVPDDPRRQGRRYRFEPESAGPNVPLRVGAWFLVVAGIVGIAAIVVANVRMTESFWDLSNFVEGAEALLANLVFLGAGIAFLVTLETRIKRGRALFAVNELRALAHIIDMHQLTKDPEMVFGRSVPTQVFSARNMTALELNRYLDYCSEMLSIASKIGALYIQSFPDSQALTAVDDIESLTNGLSRKIWQKIMILARYLDRDRGANL